MFYDDNALLPVPYSTATLFVSRLGEVTGKKERVINTYPDRDGLRWTKVSWLGNIKPHKVARLIAFTFNSIWIPVEFWHLIEVGFDDGDLTNHHPNNLHFKIPNGLEPFLRPGYAYIPDYTQYAINREGVVIHVLSGEVAPYSVMDSGYVIYQIKRDSDNRRTNLGRHRAMMLAYSNYPNNYKQLHVNHIDGIPGNDGLDNLEWTTVSENHIHAWNTTRDRGKIRENTTNAPQPVLVRYLDENIVREYNSKLQCAKELGVDIWVINDYLKRPNQPVFVGNIQVKFKSDLTPWRDVDLATEPLFEKWERRVDVKNVYTGEITTYESMHKCGEAFGVSGNTVVYWLKRKNQPLIPPGVLMKFKNDPTPWRKVDDPERELQLYGRSNKVLVKDVVSGEVKEYERQKDAAHALGISKPQMTRRIAAAGQPLWDCRFLIKKKSDASPWRDVSEEEILEAPNNKEPVEVRDVTTGVVSCYGSITEAATAIGVGKSTMFSWLRQSCKEVHSKGTQVRKLSSKEDWE